MEYRPIQMSRQSSNFRQRKVMIILSKGGLSGKWLLLASQRLVESALVKESKSITCFSIWLLLSQGVSHKSVLMCRGTRVALGLEPGLTAA